MLIYGGASLLIFLFLLGPLRARMLRRLDRLAPGGVAFTVANRRAFTDPLSLAAVGTELGETAATMTSGPGVTADNFGISFWDRTPYMYLGTLDWDRIQSITVRDWQTSLPRLSSTAVVLDVAVGRATIVLPLLSPNGSTRMFSSRREGEHLAAQLEQLRAAALAA